MVSSSNHQRINEGGILRNKLIGLAIFLATVFGLGSVALAAPTPPAKCTATYQNTIVSTHSGDQVNGTNQNDYIVATNGGQVNALDGDDCVTLSGTGNQVFAGNGNDVVIAAKGGQDLRGEDGNDYLEAPGGSQVDGGPGNDTCKVDKRQGSAINCETVIYF